MCNLRELHFPISKRIAFTIVLLQIILILTQSYDVLTIENQDEPLVIAIPYPSEIRFQVNNNSNYRIENVTCLSKDNQNKITTFGIDVCLNLNPCSVYLAIIKLENLNENETDNIDDYEKYLEHNMTVQTNYSQPSTELNEKNFQTTPFSIYVPWTVISAECVSAFYISAVSEDKDKEIYLRLENNLTEITFKELNPCQEYNVELVTFDVNGIKIGKNLTAISTTDYIEPSSVEITKFVIKSNKSVEVVWTTPEFTTCILYYSMKWIKTSCLIAEPPKCNWESYNITNPKSTDHLIDNLEGCNDYKVVITTNGDLLNSSSIDYFYSPVQKPGPVTHFTTNELNATNVTLKWQKPIQNGDCVQKYQLKIIGPLQNITKRKQVDIFEYETKETTFFVEDLKPCGIYNITIWAIATDDDLLGEEALHSFVMAAAQPTEIRDPIVKYSYPHEILISWTPPDFSELCVNFYRINGWAAFDVDNTDFHFDKETTKIPYQISDLVSCMDYIVQIIPVVSNPGFEGPSKQLRVRTNSSISAKPDIIAVKTTSASLEIRATDVDKRNRCPIIIAAFECRAAQDNATIEYAEKVISQESGENYVAVVEPLSPYTKYECGVYFYNEAGRSEQGQGVWSTYPYYPDEPTIIVANSIPDTNIIHVQWKEPNYPNGILIVYKVFVQNIGPDYQIPSHCIKPDKKTTSLETSKQEYNYSDTNAYHRYSIQIAANNNFGTGRFSESVLITSLPSVSLPMENFQCSSINGPDDSVEFNASVTLQWQPPCKPNGQIEFFQLNFLGIRPNFADHIFERKVLISNLKKIDKIDFTEYNLKPEFNYTVSGSVKIVNVSQISKQATINFLSPAGIPKKINHSSIGEIDTFSSGNPTISALVKFPMNIFRSNMGQILYAAVLLSEMNCQQDPELISGIIDVDNNWPNTSTWHDVSNEVCIKQYQTTPIRWKPFPKSKPLNLNNDTIQYIIGKDVDCKTNQLYCNGPLKSNTNYKMILRIFTRNAYADTMAMSFKTDDVVEIYIILITIVSVLLAAFFIGFIYIWINKRRIWYRQSLNGIEDQSGDVSIKNYLLHYDELSKKDKLNREFKELAVVANDANLSSTISRYNDTKNRYSNIFPYEKNRVILDIDFDGSDYINASFINGYKRKKEYIATQGPKPETFIDFWKMILQHNVKIIVMVTQLREGDIIKCHQYFPNNLRTFKFGTNITVTCKNETENEIFERRELVVKHSNDDLIQNVIHYFFKKWPDHDCPSDALDLITFIQNVKLEKLPNRSPIVVHCSAGVGRTGTFIGLDIIMQRLKNEGKINIYETVKELRFQRMKMVQNIQQYQFLYNCIYQLINRKKDLKKLKLITVNQMTLFNSNSTSNSNLDVIAAIKKESQSSPSSSSTRNSYSPNDDIESVM